MDNYQQMILFNRQQIFSIDLCMPLHISQFFSSFIIDSSLDHLQSVVLDNLNRTVLISVLQKLSSLPRLFSLTIDTLNIFIDLNEIYQIIFTLPILKYYKFSTSNPDLSISQPITTTNKQISPIEYLIIDHCCTFNGLATIISYTPELRHLNFMITSDNNLDIETISPIILSNLTHLSVYVSSAKFGQFEIFISKINSKLKVLSFTTRSKQIAYLNAKRWEEFILKYQPQLEKFYLQIYECIDRANRSRVALGKSNQFNTSFWIERQWIFEAEVDFEDIKYSIVPYRKQWYEYHQLINSSTQLSKSSRLILIFVPPDECLQIFITDIKHILTVTQIYQLEILEEKIFIGILIQIINLFPQLNSLKINSLSLNKPRNLCAKEVEIFCTIINTKKVTTVYLEQMYTVEELYFLMVLCPYMEHLKVNCINNMNIELILRQILEKTRYKCNQYLHLLCFCVPAADDEIIHKLNKMISAEQLLFDYTIKRILDNIYFQWK